MSLEFVLYLQKEFNRIEIIIFIKFNYIFIYCTALFLAIDEENTEIVNILLSNNIDVNVTSILNINFYDYTISNYFV